MTIVLDFNFVSRAAGLPAIDPEPPAEADHRCVEIVASSGTGEDAIECGRIAEGVCAYCGQGVCEKHNDPCYAKGCRLHAACRGDHFEETGHQLDLPNWVDGFAPEYWDTQRQIRELIESAR